VSYSETEWTLDLFSGESLARFRQRIMADLEVTDPRYLPTEARAQLEDVAAQAQDLGWELADKTPSLSQHVRWLFWRLCPQPDAVWGWARIAEEEYLMDVPTIKRTVEALAGEMGIVLPPLPRGRPRKGPRYT